MRFRQLMEAMDYRKEMIQPLLDSFAADFPDRADVSEDFNRQANTFGDFCDRVLKRQDRCVWFMKAGRLDIAERMEGYTGQKFDSATSKLIQRYRQKDIEEKGEEDEIAGFNTTFMDALEHFLSLPVPKIQEYRWGKVTSDRLLYDLGYFEKEWIEKNKSKGIEQSETDDIVIDFGNGWSWVNLHTAYCSKEADAMGHCGNAPRRHTKDTILSLRKKSADATWSVYATFILNEQGMLTEMKGRGNDRPSPKFNDMIVALIRSPIVKGIVGGGYKPENNFSLSTLPDDLHIEMIKEKPELANPYWYYKVFKKQDEKFMSLLEDSYMAMTGRIFVGQKGGEVTLKVWDTVTQFVSLFGLVHGDSTWTKIYDIEWENFDASTSAELGFLEDIGPFSKKMIEKYREAGSFHPETAGNTKLETAFLHKLQSYASKVAGRALMQLCLAQGSALGNAYFKQEGEGIILVMDAYTLAQDLNIIEEGKKDDLYGDFDIEFHTASQILSSDWDSIEVEYEPELDEEPGEILSELVARVEKSIDHFVKLVLGGRSHRIKLGT